MAHLATDGDSVMTARKYVDRLIVLHVKDYILTNPEISIKDNWPARGQFC